MILYSGPTVVSVPSPRKYIYVITMLAMHVSSLKWVLFYVMKIWYMLNLFLFRLRLLLVLGILWNSLKMGGEPCKQEH